MRVHSSPWLEELRSDRAISPLIGNERSDVAVVGGGIAGVATAYELLRRSGMSVSLIEAGRIAHGASGNGSGQVAPAFEGGSEILSERFGPELTEAAFRQVFSAERHLIELAKEGGTSGEVRPTNAVVGFSSIEALEAMGNAFSGGQSALYPEIKLYAAAGSGWNCLLKDKGINPNRVSAERILELLGTKDEDYRAVAVTRTRIANVASICNGLIERMLHLFPERFKLHEGTRALGVHSGNSLLVKCEKGQVECKRVIFCTNGYALPDLSGTPNSFPDDYLMCVTGYLNGYEPLGTDERVGLFFHELQPSNDEPYVFSTTWHRNPEEAVLMVGGPQFSCSVGDRERRDDNKAHDRIDHLAAEIFGIKDRASSCWDGRMGYTRSGVRLAGQDPKNPNLFYNLGCNGIGILHSIYGARRVAMELSGRKVADSVFEPRNQFS
jgi:glycine/D-amino acid oxidase-like deaminating enzyme